MEHSGHIVEPSNFVYKAAEWPLKPNQIVAVRNTVPWQAFGSTLRVYVKPVDLLHVWPLGSRPAFL